MNKFSDYLESSKTTNDNPLIKEATFTPEETEKRKYAVWYNKLVIDKVSQEINEKFASLNKELKTYNTAQVLRTISEIEKKLDELRGYLEGQGNASRVQGRNPLLGLPVKYR